MSYPKERIVMITAGQSVDPQRERNADGNLLQGDVAVLIGSRDGRHTGTGLEDRR